MKILLTNAVEMRVSEVIEPYALRWQIELYFKELKTPGFAQSSFQDFRAVKAWVETAITTVLFLEYERIKHMQDRRWSTLKHQFDAALPTEYRVTISSRQK